MKKYTVFYHTYLKARSVTMPSEKEPTFDQAKRFVEARHGHVGGTKIDSIVELKKQKLELNQQKIIVKESSGPLIK